jgi:hypothetical protein
VDGKRRRKKKKKNGPTVRQEKGGRDSVDQQSAVGEMGEKVVSSDTDVQ